MSKLTIIRYNFKPVVSGATKGACTIKTSIPLTEAPEIKITFKTHPEGPVEHVFSLENEKLELLSFDPLEFKIKEQVIDFKPYNYLYGVEIKTSNGTVYKPIKGQYPVISSINETEDDG